MLTDAFKHFITWHNKCVVYNNEITLTDGTHIHLGETRIENNYIRTNNYVVELDEFLNFLPRLTRMVQIRELTEGPDQFALVLRQANQMTFPKEILDALEVEHPAYGTVVIVELKKLILRNGQVIGTESIRTKLGGEK